MRSARSLVARAAILLGLAGVTTVAGAAEEAPPPECRKAEINPVTGHVLCIDPLGAPVEAPPERRSRDASPRMCGASGATGLIARSSPAVVEPPPSRLPSVKHKPRNCPKRL